MALLEKAMRAFINHQNKYSFMIEPLSQHYYIVNIKYHQRLPAVTTGSSQQIASLRLLNVKVPSQINHQSHQGNIFKDRLIYYENISNIWQS